MKTMIVNTANGLVMINQEDFNPLVHSAAEGEEVPRLEGSVIVPPEFDVESLRAQIEAELRAKLEPEIRAQILAEMATLAPADGAITPGIAESNDSGTHLVIPADTVAGGAEQTPPPVNMLVKKKGKKHFVIGMDGVDVARDGINAEGYDSEQAAWDAILTLPAQ